MTADEEEKIDVHGIVKKPAKQKRPRPDGCEEDHYKNLEKWTYHRWAWEFLRRNDNFIKECEKIKACTDCWYAFKTTQVCALCDYPE